MPRYKKLALVYFGTPDFSAQFLEKLLNDKNLPIEVMLVVTQPDKPVGRKKILTPSPVKEVAINYNIQIITELITGGPTGGDPRQRATQRALAGTRKGQAPYFNFKNIDLALLFAYGEIIPAEILKLPRLGFLNIHPSLLPKYRGASPTAYPLIMGNDETGVTLMKMDDKLDHGPIIAQKKYKILSTDKRPDLEIKLANLGYEMFKNHVSCSRLHASYKKQNHKQATYTRRLTKQDGFISMPALKKALDNKPLTFDELPEIIKEYYQSNIDNCKSEIGNSAELVNNLFRGLYPWPGIWTLLRQGCGEQAKIYQPRRLKITDLSLDMLHDLGFMLRINRVQLEGKREVSFRQFNRKYQVFL